MRARVLEPEEWSKVEAVPLIPFVSPENVDIVAVEDDGGSLIACMTVMRVTHYEGLWIHPEHRNAGVARSLLRVAANIAKARGEQWVIGGSADKKMTRILKRLNAKRMPLEFYALSVGGEECQQQL